MVNELKPCPFCGHPKSRLLFKREYCEGMQTDVCGMREACE